jgi:2-polyprenyl-6-methoxyphenol hydroxylase-like FAD-dependent oxidoreductase
LSSPQTPFAGEGINLALEDCAELANAIQKAASGAELDQHVQVFEEELFPRAERTAQLTADMMHVMFMIPGSPRNGIESYILLTAEDELGWWLTKLCTPLVYAYFAVFRLLW